VVRRIHARTPARHRGFGTGALKTVAPSFIHAPKEPTMLQPAAQPVRRDGARLLAIDASGRLSVRPRAQLTALCRPGDLVVANDAATLPASLLGLHLRTGAAIEVRLAARRSLRPDDVQAFDAVVFGPGDHRTTTERRLPPPALRVGDQLQLGPLRGTVQALLNHPRLVRLALQGDPARIWAGLARHGRPVQYAHVPERLPLWAVWTPIAALPVAFEAPSAGYALDWALLDRLRRAGVGFATLTHAAGLSSTGDPALDARLPFDEPYDLPTATVDAIAATHRRGGRVIAIGTTVVRALEHAAARALATDAASPRRTRRPPALMLPAGPGLADQRIGPDTALQVVDVMLTGTHEPGTSHHALMHAFASARVLGTADQRLAAEGFQGHEFGDSIWLARQARPRGALRHVAKLRDVQLAARDRISVMPA